jgi:hypothetical protein
VEINQADKMYTSELSGELTPFGKKLKRTRQELLALSPRDKKRSTIYEYVKLSHAREVRVKA